MPRPLISIYDFCDYRSFLKDVHSHLKESDSKYSHRFIAEKVGASAGGWFSNVISGRIALTGTYRIKLSKFLQLNSHECDYFDYLVGYEHASSVEEKRIIMLKMIAHKGVQPKVIGKDQFEFYSRWYISAIRELLFIYDFSDSYSYSELAKMVMPKITTSEAKTAVQLLLEMDLIEVNSKGFLKPKATTIKADTRFQIVHWVNQMESKGELGVEAITRFNKDERNISEVFVPLSEESYGSVVAEIEALRKKILALSAEDLRSNRVYQCNIQLFPLSKPMPLKENL